MLDRRKRKRSTGSSRGPSPCSRTAAGCIKAYCCLLRSPRREHSCPAITSARFKGQKAVRIQTGDPHCSNLSASDSTSGSVCAPSPQLKKKSNKMSGCGGAPWIKFAGNVRTGVATTRDWRKRRGPPLTAFPNTSRRGHTGRGRHQLVVVY